jgi:prophage regulatory protein
MTTYAENPPWHGMEPSGRLLRPSEVSKVTGLSRSQLYQMISEGRFPPFLKLSFRASALPEAWLNAFIGARAREAIAAAIETPATETSDA